MTATRFYDGTNECSCPSVLDVFALKKMGLARVATCENSNSETSPSPGGITDARPPHVISSRHGGWLLVDLDRSEETSDDQEWQAQRIVGERQNIFGTGAPKPSQRSRGRCGCQGEGPDMILVRNYRAEQGSDQGSYQVVLTQVWN